MRPLCRHLLSRGAMGLIADRPVPAIAAGLADRGRLPGSFALPRHRRRFIRDGQPSAWIDHCYSELAIFQI